ncbi:MAG TPA: HD domain-containing protein [Clostridia bacterium]|nr:HD domain-containing protein [Clostridia bacterium]
MKEFYIRDAAQQENKVIATSFLVTSKQVKPKKTGEPYLDLLLADCSGNISAKMWDNVSVAGETFDVNDVIRVRGVFNKYNHRWQFTIRSVEGKLREDQIDFSDYLPKTSKDVEQLWKTVGEFVASITDPHLRALLEAFMSDPKIAQAYKNAPAAKTLHHAFIGGLLDHVVSLFTTCDLVVRNYPLVNRDLVLTGAFLHDIGKIHELAYSRSFSYTTEGQLLGHMIIELEMLHEKIRLVPGFPGELKILVEHLIISHHGQYEFGSPKLPMFPEALMLHYLDDLDSKMEAMRAQIERDADLESPWTNYNPSLARPLLNTRKFLGKKPEPQAAAAAASNGNTE